MSENDRKNEMIERLLQAFPVRDSEIPSSRANLDKLSVADLDAWITRLDTAYRNMKHVTVSDKASEPDQEVADRRRDAQQKIATGLTKLASVTKKIAVAARQPEPDPQGKDNLVVALEPHPQDSTVFKKAGPVDKDQDNFVNQSKIDKEADNLWLYPLIVNKIAESTLKTLGPMVAARAIDLKESRTYSEIKILPVDNTMLGVDQLQSLVVNNLVRLFDGNNNELQHQERVSDLTLQLAQDPAFTKYFQIQIASMVRDVFQMVTENYALREKFNKISPFIEGLQPQARAPSPAVETTFIPDKSSDISEILLIDGMAKMIARTREYDPECVVVIGGGGQILGKLIQSNFKNSAKFIFVDPGTDTILQRNIPRNCSRILVIDDIARTGETMRDEISKCRQLHKKAAVRGMALVGTTKSYTLLGDEVFFPNLSAAPEPRVPWDRNGHYFATTRNYILGRGGETQFSFAKTLLGRAVMRMMPASIA